jgi:hypothetical protein
MRSLFRKSGAPPPPTTTLLAPPTHPSASPLTIIELFQSQGCNSCPPTNGNLLSLTDPNILLLTYHVTYWDYLGWTDVFAHSTSDARQRDYVRRLGLRSAFTPQVIVNGRVSGVGNTAQGLEKLLREGTVGDSAPVEIRVALDGDGKAHIGISGTGRDVGKPGDRAPKLDVYLVGYNSNLTNVHVKNGENAGRVLPHRNVVKALSLIGEADVGADSNLVVETGRLQAGLGWVVIVQLGPGGPVLGAKSLDLGREKM